MVGWISLNQVLTQIKLIDLLNSIVQITRSSYDHNVLLQEKVPFCAMSKNWCSGLSMSSQYQDLKRTYFLTGHPRVVGPPTVALVGDDSILPCHLDPAADAVSMILEWGRPDLKPRFVHVWHEGQDLLVNQNPSYRGRTSLSTDKLKHGDFHWNSLK